MGMSVPCLKTNKEEINSILALEVVFILYEKRLQGGKKQQSRWYVLRLFLC